MTPAARDWIEGLKRFSEEHRAIRPARTVPVPSETDPADGGGDAGSDLDRGPAALAAQERILADHARLWGRSAILSLAGRHPEVAIAITTSSPGLDAMQAVVADLPAPLPDRIVAVTELAYRHWCLRAPDEEHRLHVVLWSWIKAPLPKSRRGEFAAHRVPDHHSCWLLRFGHAAAVGEWRRTDLWAWDGATARLVATDVTETFRSR